MTRTILSAFALIITISSASAQTQQNSFDFLALRDECSKAGDTGLCKAAVDYLRISHEMYADALRNRKTDEALSHLAEFNRAMDRLARDFPAVWARRTFAMRRSI